MMMSPIPMTRMAMMRRTTMLTMTMMWKARGWREDDRPLGGHVPRRVLEANARCISHRRRPRQGRAILEGDVTGGMATGSNWIPRRSREGASSWDRRGSTRRGSRSGGLLKSLKLMRKIWWLHRFRRQTSDLSTTCRNNIF
jgi:hypothetical protein